MSLFRIYHKTLGGHVHMRVFSATRPNTTFAKLGDLCCDEKEFDDLRRAMTGVQFRPEETEEER